MAESTTPRLRVAHYGMAVLVVGVALLLRMGLLSVVPLRSPFLMLFAAVMVAAVYGGLGPGILATLLAALASDLLFVGDSLGDVARLKVTNPGQLGLFVLEGVFLSLLGAMLFRARRRAEMADAAARQLEQKILEISEDERRRIGHDLHDGLGQHLTGIALLAKALKQRLIAADFPDAEQAARIPELVNQAIGWTRDLARGLSPVTLDTGGLGPALEELAVNASNLLGVKCECQHDAAAYDIDAETALHLYRIAQEAINNSVKHGKASRVVVSLKTAGGRMTMSIADDGSGLSSKTRSNPGIGLQIMQYRARIIGATISVAHHGTAGGTIVECSLPVGLVPQQEKAQLHVETPTV
jgi:signal transduction histidine kinase